MTIVIYGKCYLWQTYYGKCNYGKSIYGKSIMTNVTEPFLPGFVFFFSLLKFKVTTLGNSKKLQTSSK